MKAIHTTREQWLNAAVRIFRGWFSDQDFDLPKLIMVSVGFPSRNALSSRNRAIGQCWSEPDQISANSKQKTWTAPCHIFISPVLSDPLRVADVVSLNEWLWRWV